MSFAEWGAESAGPRIAAQDEENAALNSLRLASGVQTLKHAQAMDPWQVRLTAAQAQEHEAKGQQLAQQMKVMAEWNARRQARQGAPGGDPADPTAGLKEDLREQADLAMQMGDVAKASQILARLSQADSRDALVDSRRATADKATFETATAKLDRAIRLAQGAQSQEEWDAARGMYMSLFGEDNDMFKVPFSPATRDQLVNSAVDFKTKLTDEYRQSRLEQIDTAEARRQSYQDSMLELARRRVRIAEERLHRVGKAGAGRPDKAPNRDQRGAAMRRIAQDWQGKLGDADLSLAADSIAMGANALVRQNPGLSYGDALERAYAAQKPNFASIERPGMLGGILPNQNKFIPNLHKALPTPNTAAGLRKGRLYRDGNVVKMWNGARFVEPTGTADVSSGDSDADLED